MSPLINILIRNKYRPDLFRRCIRSIAASEYPHVNLIIACDSSESLKDVVDVFGSSKVVPTIVPVIPQKEHSHYWNLYCNDLKSKVTEGWFFFLDNDDYLANGALMKLAEVIKDTDPVTGIICQFDRNGRPKPSDVLIRNQIIEKGRIGGGCIVLHHTTKNLANWDGEQAADFRFIEKIKSWLPLKFIHLVLQIAGNNGLHGK